jgi:hypothetical protein
MFLFRLGLRSVVAPMYSVHGGDGDFRRSHRHHYMYSGIHAKRQLDRRSGPGSWLDTAISCRKSERASLLQRRDLVLVR